MTNYINCTPHAITVEGLGTLPPSGILPRCATVRRVISEEGITPRIVAQSFGAVEGLPQPQENTVFIVSGMVLTALAGMRHDVAAPDTGPDAIRENGQIVAVRGFVV